MCPYYDERYKTCTFYGHSQEGYQKENYCLSSTNWKSCSNYTCQRLEEKLSKKVRPNPDL